MRANTGFLDVLNVGAGHLTFRYDGSKGEEEKTKAKKVINDMLRRGYMIFVKVDGEQKRVRAFDEAHEEYILEEPDDGPPEEEQVPDVAEPKRRRGRPPGRRVAMTAGQATGIGPTAGG